MTNDTLYGSDRLLFICMVDMELRGLHNREVGKF